MISHKGYSGLLSGLLFFLLWSFSAQAKDINEIEIMVLPETIVYGDTYTLGDIAEINGFNIEVIEELAKVKMGRTPLAGNSYLLTRRKIRSHLIRNFPNRKFDISMPKKAMISRASLKITALQQKEILDKEIRKRYKDYDEVKITLKTRLKDVYIPKGRASYIIKRVGRGNLIGGNSTWILSLESDNKAYKKIIVRSKVEVVEDVFVARNIIKRGKQVKKEDIKSVKKDISKEKIGFEVKQELIVGKEARRDIFKNETVEPHMVDQPIVLTKGSPVKVVYKTANMYLSNLAVAMRSGKKGDVIPVRTIKDKKTIYVVIINSKIVEVAL